MSKLLTLDDIKTATMIRLQSGANHAAGSWTDVTYTKDGKVWRYKGTYRHDNGRDLPAEGILFVVDTPDHMNTYIACKKCCCVVLERKELIPKGCQLEFDFDKGEKK